MKLFTCSACQEIVHFENSQCTHCEHALAFLPERGALAALEQIDGSGVFGALGAEAAGARYRLCGNQIDHEACNWAVPDGDGHRFCRACRLNEIIPNLSDPKARDEWIKLERAKRRLVYTLLALRLPVEPRSEQATGLAFSFKQDLPGEDKVLIGHHSGLITINIAEADSPFREKTRIELGESYRTLLGHFRHESGHHYWDRLIAGSAFLDRFRERFGDERPSYDQAVEIHYRDGAPPDWRARFVSSYASMHPWEDWAESWAHYLHMVDTLETASSFGLAVHVKTPRGKEKLDVTAPRIDFADFDELRKAWVPLTIVLNGLNRSMGLPDAYAFVLSLPAWEKIRFVHDVVEKSRAALGRAA